ncbi:MAG TPA: hypothetical protein VGN57_15305 [Pirellulaceae bacterium]|jgi:hypothetical protein|nr:hypothetical protein [Pirellulaceae bacterium]
MRTLVLKCKAPAWFDPETQKYELCPGRIEATVDQAGRKLDCPVCDAPMDVPSAAFFQDLAPRQDPDAPVPGLDDEFQLAPATPRAHGVPSATPPRTAGKGPTGTIASARASSAAAQAKAAPTPAKAVPDQAPAQAVPSKTTPARESEQAKKPPADERLSVGDLSGDDDEGGASTPIRHAEKDSWMTFAADSDPPPVNTRVKALMDDDDADEYQVSAPAVTPSTPTSATSSRAHAPVFQGDAYDEYVAGKAAEGAEEGSPSASGTDEAGEAIDLGGFAVDDAESGGPADDWLSAPLPGVGPVPAGFAPTPLAPAPTSSGHLTDASRVLAPSKTEWVPRHRILAAQEIACPQCRAPLQRDVELCDRCGYHLRLKRVVKNYSEPKEQLGGFDYWLKQHLHEHATVGGLKVLFGVLAPIGTLAALVVLWSVVGVFALCLVVPLVFLGVTLAAVCLIPGPRGSDPFNPWWAILQFQRLSGWKLFHKSTIPLGVIERRTREFDDAALDQMPELETTDVLDLEGSSVTDEGIRILRFYKNLKFLVVRDTQVTALGVKNLQFEFPELLIWR